MTVLPIVEHQLRVGSRRWTTYWSRPLFAAIASFFGAGMVATFNTIGPGGSAARQLMGTVTFFLFFYCVLVGVKMTSDMVSAEKREGTLGLLFLTDLKGYDIVFGKLAAGALRPVYGLLAMLPILALGLISGGFRWVEGVRLGAGVLNTLFLSLAIGICFSVFSWEQKRTQSNALGLAILFWFVVPGLSRLWLRLVPGQPIGLLLSLLSPSYAQSMALTPIPGGPSDYFWWSILWVHLEAWLFLSLAIWWIPRCWMERNLATGKMSRKERRQQSKYGRAAVRQRIRLRLLEINPFLWLVSRERGKSLGIWIVLVVGSILTGFFVWMLAPLPGRSLELMLVIIFGLSYLFLKLRFADEAGRELAAQRSTGSLELVLSTPLSVAEIIQGQWLALRRQFGGPILAFLMLGFSLLVLGLFQPELPAVVTVSKVNPAFLFLVVMAMLVVDAVALGWVGMWMGLRLRKPREIAGSAVARIMVLPTVLFVFLTNLGALWHPLSWLPESSPDFKLGLWLVLGIANDIAFIVVSRRKLHGHFRDLASRFYLESGSRGGWGRWLGHLYARLRRRFSAVSAVESMRRL